MTAATSVTLPRIADARENIADVVLPTPILGSSYLTMKTSRPICLKLENLNISGSFKIRGATHAIRAYTSEGKVSPTAGVVCASAGNHAQGMAYIGRRLGVPVQVFMPERTPLIKIEATRSLGADVHVGGTTYEDAYSRAEEAAHRTGAALIHGFADPNIIAGQGTVGLEILSQVPDISAVVVPIGGGGLIGGIACAIKESNPKVRVIGVESVSYTSMSSSLKAGSVVTTPPARTIADGIALRTVSDATLSLVRRYVDHIVQVHDDEIAAAVMKLVERNHLLAEGAGAASVAGLLKLATGSVDADKVLGPGQGRIVCVISGGNIDVNLLSRITAKGLVHSGRMMRVRVKIQDKPGGLAGLLDSVANLGGNIVEVHHNRWFGASQYHEVEVDLDVETINVHHQERMLTAFETEGYPYTVLSASRYLKKGQRT